MPKVVKVIRGSPARSRSGLNERYVTLPTSTCVPMVELKTRSMSCHDFASLILSISPALAVALDSFHSGRSWKKMKG
jgi:hypothetical protein